MSSDSSDKLVIVFSESVQENNNHRNSKRKRKDTDVAETSSKKTRGSQISHSAEHCNTNHINVRKRRAVDDGQIISKKIRCSNISRQGKDTDISLEEVRIQSGKRKTSDDDGRVTKKRCVIKNQTDEPMISKKEPLVQTKKRKIIGDVVAPEKKMRLSNCSNSKELSSSESIANKHRVIFNNVSPEEEKIYEMASSWKTNRMDFDSKFVQLDPIGSGGFGSVYSGYRKEDLIRVAIKHIPKNNIRFKQVVCNGKLYNIILEVALMLKATGLPEPTAQSAAVSLLDWYMLEDELILVMEKPVICKDLHKYRGFLKEREAKIILRQLVDAAIDMHSRGVFHRDIKLQNVLLELNSGEPRVRVIDFGCGSFSTESSYSEFCGTRAYFPPEWFDHGRYQACPTTVWQLGALFYSLLNKHGRFNTTHFINDRIQISKALSTDCKVLLHMCLARDPAERATLEELQLCPALRNTSFQNQSSI